MGKSPSQSWLKISIIFYPLMKKNPSILHRQTDKQTNRQIFPTMYYIYNTCIQNGLKLNS